LGKGGGGTGRTLKRGPFEQKKFVSRHSREKKQFSRKEAIEHFV